MAENNSLVRVELLRLYGIIPIFHECGAEPDHRRLLYCFLWNTVKNSTEGNHYKSICRLLQSDLLESRPAKALSVESRSREQAEKKVAARGDGGSFAKSVQDMHGNCIGVTLLEGNDWGRKEEASDIWDYHRFNIYPCYIHQKINSIVIFDP